MDATLGERSSAVPTFLAYVRELFGVARREAGVTQRYVAEEVLYLTETALSRRLSGAHSFHVDEIIQLDRFFSENFPALVQPGALRRRAFRDHGGQIQHSPARQLVPGSQFLEYSRPTVWNSTLDRMICHDATERPGEAAAHARALAGLFAGMATHRLGPEESKAYARLADLASLVEVWSLINCLPTEQFEELRTTIRGVLQRYPERSVGDHGDAFPSVDEILAFGRELESQTRRMEYRRAFDLPLLESTTVSAEKSRPAIAGLFYEELVKHQMISQEYSIETVMTFIARGRASMGRDRTLEYRMARFSDVEARAIWAKGDGPRQGIDHMRRVVEHLAAAAQPDKNLLVRTRTYEGLMWLEVDRDFGLRVIMDAYEMAKEIKLHYHEELLEEEVVRRSGDDIKRIYDEGSISAERLVPREAISGALS